MIKNIEDIELNNKVVFIRVDFNVPLNTDKTVADDTRIKAALETIEYVVEAGGRVVLASHLGRPKGKIDPDLSLEPVGAHLAGLLDKPIVFADDCVGDGVRKNIRDLREGEILLLENLRFYEAERSGDFEFARALAAGVDVYINDAFGCAHRDHASTAKMLRFVRDCGAGRLMMREIETLTRMLKSPEKPFVAVIGGAKVSDKLEVLNSLVRRCNSILIGGAMAYTFLVAAGRSVGKSRVESDRVAAAELILKAAKARKVKLFLPSDHVVASTFDESAKPEIVSEIREDFMGLDIGPETIARYTEVIANAKTVFWNGPMGVFEWASFSAGTTAIAEAMASTEALTVVGGGDSVSALKSAKKDKSVTHVSTGGGASLALMEGKILPGLKALET